MFNAIVRFHGAVLGFRSFIRLVRDPNRLEEVFRLSDRTDTREVLEKAAARLASHPQGAAALQRKRRLPSYRLADLALLPEGTLGREHAGMMLRNGLDPAAIPVLNAQDTAEYVRAHIYETHDIWHVATGFGVDVKGELGLQAFYLAQVGAPVFAVILAAGLLNAAFFRPEELGARMDEIVRGWREGKRAKPLFGIDWDEYWARSLAEVRRELGIGAASLPVAGRSEAQVSAEHAS